MANFFVLTNPELEATNTYRFGPTVFVEVDELLNVNELHLPRPYVKMFIPMSDPVTFAKILRMRLWDKLILDRSGNTSNWVTCKFGELRDLIYDEYTALKYDELLKISLSGGPKPHYQNLRAQIRAELTNINSKFETAQS